MLYTTAGTRRAVVALDAATGELKWVHSESEGARAANSPRQLSGRGVAYWTDGRDERILYVTTGYQLVALDAKTGARIASFGKDGIVDLKEGVVVGKGVQIDLTKGEIGLHATPAVTRDGVVLIGSSFLEGGTPRTHNNTKGLVRGFDVRTGKRLWTFNTIPRPGEFGNDTWLNESWAVNGNVGVWNQMAADEELGLAYLPVETPSSDFYGGLRPGNNLFAESIVAIDYKTGRRKWHFQLVHHPIWNMDIAAAPMLVDLTIDGQPVKAVAAMGKQAMLYLFNRVDRRTDLSDRGAAGAAVGRAGRKDVADAAVSDQAARLRSSGRDAREPDRLHAGAAGGSGEDRIALQDRTDFHAAARQQGRGPDCRVPVLGRHELARRLVRPGDAHRLHPVVHRHADPRPDAAAEQGVLRSSVRVRQRADRRALHLRTRRERRGGRARAHGASRCDGSDRHHERRRRQRQRVCRRACRC